MFGNAKRKKWLRKKIAMVERFDSMKYSFAVGLFKKKKITFENAGAVTQ